MANEDLLSPAKGIVDVIAAAVPDITTGWDFSVGGWTETPDAQITVIDRGGLTAEPNVAVDYPSVQILGRGSSAPGGYEALYAEMVKVRNVLLGISKPTAWPQLTQVNQVGHIAQVGKDDKGRPQLSLNLRLILSFDSSGLRVL